MTRPAAGTRFSSFPSGRRALEVMNDVRMLSSQKGVDRYLWYVSNASRRGGICECSHQRRRREAVPMLLGWFGFSTLAQKEPRKQYEMCGVISPMTAAALLLLLLFRGRRRVCNGERERGTGKRARAQASNHRHKGQAPPRLCPSSPRNPLQSSSLCVARLAVEWSAYFASPPVYNACDAVSRSSK